MFVQSHIQRNRYQLSTTAGSSSGAQASQNQQHHGHRSEPSSISSSSNQASRQSSATRSSSRANELVRVKTSRLHANECSSEDRQVRAAANKAPGKQVQLAGSGAQRSRDSACVGQRRDRVETSRDEKRTSNEQQQVERVSARVNNQHREAPDEWELLAWQALAAQRNCKQHRPKRAHDFSTGPGRADDLAKFEIHANKLTRSISFDLIEGSPYLEPRRTQGLSHQAGSQTISELFEEKGTEKGADKWTQVNGSLSRINQEDWRHKAEAGGEEARDVFDCPPLTGWIPWLTKLKLLGSAEGATGSSGLQLKKRLAVIASFWASFIAFQYESLKQICEILFVANRANLDCANNSMIRLGEEYLVATVAPGSVEQPHQQQHQQHARPSWNCRTSGLANHVGNYRNYPIASFGAVDGQPPLGGCNFWPRHYCQHEHQRDQSRGEPNGDVADDDDDGGQFLSGPKHKHKHKHTHKHNHTHSARFFVPQFSLAPTQVIDFNYSAAPAACPAPFEPNAPLLIQNPSLELQEASSPTIGPHASPIPARRQAQTNCDLGWQRYLRHTVDGSPVDQAARRELTFSRWPNHSSQQDSYQSGTFESNANSRASGLFQNHRASISSPTLLESNARDWKIVGPSFVVKEGAQTSPTSQRAAKREADWQLCQSSDELSVISDHEPADRSSCSDSAGGRTNRQAPGEAANLRPMFVGERAGDHFVGSTSVDRNEPNGWRWQQHLEQASGAKVRAGFVRAPSLSKQHTWNASERSASPAASSLNRHVTRTEPRDGAGSVRNGSTGHDQRDRASQQQAGGSGGGGGGGGSSSSCSKKKPGALGKVSLAGAKKRLGFRRRGGGLSSLSVHRSEEIFPSEPAKSVVGATGGDRRRLFASSNTTGSSSFNDSSCDLDPMQPANSRLRLDLFRASPDPKSCFVDGLGAGQIASRQALVSPYLGDIQLGLSDRRGMLEVEVIRVRQLHLKPAAKRLPSPYVKVYLMREKKCLAKFKTSQMRETLDPLYQKRFIFRDDYSNCVLQVIVWGDYGKKDKKSLMGAVQIRINELDMSNLVIGWYKLFNAPSLTNLALASSSKVLRQTMSSSRLASDLGAILSVDSANSSWQAPLK